MLNYDSLIYNSLLMRTIEQNHEVHSEESKEALALAHEMHLQALGALDGAPKL